jgi:site-specific DNA-methyltransferase (adenine-specific)
MCSPRSDVQAEMVIKLKEAGFEVNFSPVYWVYASGFPKSMNISKAVDRKLGIEPNVVGIAKGMAKQNPEFNGTAQGRKENYLKPEYEKTIPTSDEAKRLDGSYAGFQPKPSVEVIIVAMKPLSEKTYVDQALKNGKGITWLDDGRIPYQSDNDKDGAVWGKDSDISVYGWAGGKDHKGENDGRLSSDKGRFPANLLVQDNTLDTGIITKSTPSIQPPDNKGGTGNSLVFKHPNGSVVPYDDSGDLSRYFDLDMWYSKNIEELPDYVQRIFPFLYVPKPSNGERNEDLEGEPEQKWLKGGVGTGISARENIKAKNIHPTVKPLKLMSYLVIIGSRPGDTILDPFMGSGTTGVASKILHRDFIGFEIEGKYFEIAQQRIENKVAKGNITEFEEDE